MASGDQSGIPLSILILARNEQIHIERCISSVQALGAPIFVVDSHSTDGTADLAAALGARVFQCDERGFSDKLNWALTNVPFASRWVMRLDADEVPSDAMLSALPALLDSVSQDVCGLSVRRQIWFMGQWIKHGGIYPSWTTRIWRTGSARCEARDLDEHMLLSRGSAAYIPLDLKDDPLTDLSHWIEKHNRYATSEASAAGRGAGEGLLTPRLLGSPPERIRWIKMYVFYHLPPFFRPLAYFFYRYFLRFGFLDGKRGFIFHFLHALWYRILVDAKLLERARQRLK